MYCTKCGNQIETGAQFCTSCGKAVNVQPLQPPQTPVYQPTITQPVAVFKPICLIAIIICALLWLATPFMAVNRATLSRNSGQPTALQIITDDVSAIGDMANSPVFWAALISIIGIAICFFCTLAKKNTATRVLAILTDISLAIAMLSTLNALSGDAGVTEVAGIGYFGIFILLLLVVFISGNKRVVTNQSQQAYQAAGTYSPQASSLPIQQANSSQPQPLMEQDGDGKGMCILAYISILWIAGLVSVHKNKSNVRFHVGQGIVLSIFSVAGSIATQIITAVLYSTMTTEQNLFGYTYSTPSPAASVLSLLISLALFAICITLMIIGIVHASKGEMKPLPIIGKLAFYGKGSQMNQYYSGQQMGGISTFYFNGKEYLAIDDEHRYLELAHKGITSAQHGLGLFYATQRNDIDQALYWFCVAEYNGEEQSTNDLNYISSTYPNPEWLNQRIAYHRGEVSKNPVYKETFEDIIEEMAHDPNLRNNNQY